MKTCQGNSEPDCSPEQGPWMDGTNACSDRLRYGDLNTPHGSRRVGTKQRDVV